MDTHNIIPRSIPEGGAVVRPFEFQVRTLLDYDVNFLQDRVVSEVFVNGQKAGVYACARVEEYPQTASQRRHVIEKYGPDLERLVVDEFMGLGYRRQALEAEVATLKAYIHRERWFHFLPVRRRVRSLRERLAALVAPCEEASDA